MNKVIIIFSICVFNFFAFAKTQSPYIGQENRSVKALSKQEVEGYLNGKGLGYAKAAELNQYPGPRHVLDLGTELSLSTNQILKTQRLFDSMKINAINYGVQLIEKEKELDIEFANKTIDPQILKQLVTDISTIESNIRFIHLNAHLEQKSILSEHQVKQYDQLRGYNSSNENEHKHSH